MKNKSLQFAIGFILVVCMLVGGGSGMVLCIGDDGHIAVEPVHHGRCGHTRDAAGQEHDGAALSDASSAICESGGCVDMPLTSDNVPDAAKNLRHDRLVKRSVADNFPGDYQAFVQAGIHGPRLPPREAILRLSRSLLEKRTIVLLI